MNANRLPMTPCKRCGKAHVNRNGYCADHQALVVVWSKKRVNKAAVRNGSTRSWRQLRQTILLRDKYTCALCGCLGVNEVDHKLSKAFGGTDEPSNLQAICKRCHKLKTQSESLYGRQLVLGEGVEKV